MDIPALENWLWDAACSIRGPIDAPKFKEILQKVGFEETSGGFQVTFCRDIFTEENLRKMGLNERQLKAVMYVKERGRITNKEYQETCGVRKRQATDDLKELEDKEILRRVGITGKGTYYVLKER